MMKKVSVVIFPLFFAVAIGFLGFATMTSFREKGMSNSPDMQTQNDNDNGMHQHKEIRVDSSLPIPSLKVFAYKDKVNGYNLELKTENFQFSPQTVNEEHKPNIGHAHLFINGMKITRIYGYWYYLSADLLKSGENKIEIYLSANDHSDLLVGEQHIMDSILLAK